MSDLKDAWPILLAEDSEDDLMLMRRACRQVGIEGSLNVVRDGDQALKYLHGEAVYADRTAYPFPSLVLLDLKMPKKSGFDVLEDLQRAGGVFKTLPILVLTSSSRDADLLRAYELGAKSYLVKQGTKELVEMLKSLKVFWGHPALQK